MKYVLLENQTERRLSFYLAMEEYIARHMEDDDDLFFMWQVKPTVIFGRNQSLENEVNVDYCRIHGIEMYRRKSGGGCVYADQSNIMMSYISKEENVGLTFNRFVNMLLLVLRKMGIEATGTSHNDVMIGDKKVSGAAFYHLPGRRHHAQQAEVGGKGHQERPSAHHAAQGPHIADAGGFQGVGASDALPGRTGVDARRGLGHRAIGTDLSERRVYQPNTLIKLNTKNLRQWQ